MTIEDDLQALREDFDVHKAEQNERWAANSEGQEKNAENIERLLTAVTEQTKSTEGVVAAYNDVQAAARVGVGLQKVCLFLCKLGAGGAVIAAAITYLVKNFSP